MGTAQFHLLPGGRNPRLGNLRRTTAADPHDHLDRACTMTSSSPSTRQTSRFSSVIRRDQAPASTWRNGSGLPMPATGPRRGVVDQPVDALRVARLYPSQNVQPSQPWGVRTRPTGSGRARHADLAYRRLSSSCRALAGTRRRCAVASSALESTRDRSTASPLREVTSMGVRSSFTCSISGLAASTASCHAERSVRR